MDVTKVRSERVIDKGVQGTNASEKAQKKEVELQGKNSPVTQSNTSTVQWSEDAKLLSEGLQSVKSAPDVRADKVAALKAKIASGDYKVDSKAIADKMINESLADDLLTRKG